MAPYSTDDVFSYLVGGVAEASKKNFRYPYPLLFQQALNKLSTRQLQYGKEPFPLRDQLVLFEEPIGTWWPGPLPEDVESNLGTSFTLLYDGQPEAWVWDFLDERGAKFLSPESLQYFQADIDQSAIREVQDTCRKATPQLVDVYVAVRRFLIEHPATTLFEFHQALGRFPQLAMKLINSFYETPDIFERYGKYDGCYWLCPYCRGILNWKDGRFPQCARHSVCGRLFPDYQGRQPLTERPDLIRLKWGLHRRVCIPGIPEIRLFDWLDNLRTQQRGLDLLQLWPGVDRYDLQLRFADGKTVWAIDIKDYSEPIELYQKIHEQSLYDLGDLKWTQGFYIIPQYRLRWNPHYLKQFKQAAGKGKRALPANIDIVSEEQFRNRVLRKLQTFQVGR